MPFAGGSGDIKGENYQCPAPSRLKAICKQLFSSGMSTVLYTVLFHAIPSCLLRFPLPGCSLLLLPASPTLARSRSLLHFLPQPLGPLPPSSVLSLLSHPAQDKI